MTPPSGGNVPRRPHAPEGLPHEVNDLRKIKAAAPRRAFCARVWSQLATHGYVRVLKASKAQASRATESKTYGRNCQNYVARARRHASQLSVHVTP